MKKLSIKLAIIATLGVASINFTACNEKKVENAAAEVTEEIDSIEAPDVDITPDSKLEDAAEAVVKDYEGVKADVEDGVIVLEGSISKDRLPALMQAINNLKPKKVENKLELK